MARTQGALISKSLKFSYSEGSAVGSHRETGMHNYRRYLLKGLVGVGGLFLVSKYFKSICSNWNLLHNVKIGEYDVEIYLQDENEPHISTGQYSLKNNEWLVKPSKIDFKPDENLIKIKSEYIMNVIDAIESNYNNGSTYDEIIGDLKKIWNKIKEGRRSGLSKEGEYSVENLVFKLLRRNGYIGKIIDIRTKSYDEKFNK
jgi:hypothetical protein